MDAEARGLGRGNPAGVIYGVLAIGAVVAAESTRRETYAKVVGASVITLVLYWLAHAYAHHLGGRLRQPARWTLAELGQALGHEAYILVGSALPLLALGAAWALGAQLETAVTAALWAAGLELALLELSVGVFRRLPVRELVTQSLLGVALGIGVLGVRVLLH